MNIIELEVWEICLAGALVAALAASTFIARLGIASSLLISAFRMVLQLSLIGLVLRELFEARQPWLVGVIALMMLSVAGREVSARQKYRLRGIWGYGIGTSAMFVSSFAVSIFGLAAVIRADPWWDPRYAIPVLGMLLGNTMTAVALSIDRLTVSAWQGREMIEARLMLGETGREAVSDLVREALRSGLMPVINSMAVAGLVSLPGMMTGQILAGNPPSDAVRYQILIWLLIAAGCGFGMLIAVRMAAGRLFDERDRLRLDRLTDAGRSGR